MSNLQNQAACAVFALTPGFDVSRFEVSREPKPVFDPVGPERFELARRKPEVIACIQAMAQGKKRGKKNSKRYNRPPVHDTAMVQFLGQQVKTGVYPRLISVPRDRKTQGEYAELVFMVKAMKEGLTPAKPWGDSKRYDFIVDNDRQLFRVQVRSASVLRSGTFRIHATTGAVKRPFKASEVDFLVAYIIPLDCWYVIPVAEIVGCDDSIWLFPTVLRSRSKYEKHREAWHLLK